MSPRYERVEEHRGYKFIRLKSGRKLSYWDARTAADRSFTALTTAVSRCFKLVGSDYDLDRLEDFIGQVDEWSAAIHREVERRRDLARRKDRVARLRNTTGRTPQEAAAYRAKADELERRETT